MPPQPRSSDARIRLLLHALGIDAISFQRFLEWALCEHLVSVLAKSSLHHPTRHFRQARYNETLQGPLGRTDRSGVEPGRCLRSL
jgi:hypothetical protein